MYVISNASRIYNALFLCLCAAFLFAPSLAYSSDTGYWSVLEKRFIPSAEVPSAVQSMLGSGVKIPSGSTTSTLPSTPAISKNALGGLSSTTQSVINTMGQPSSYSSTINYSVEAAKTALKSCVRSPACVGRGLGAGAIIYEGIHAWKEVYDLVMDEEGQIIGDQEVSVIAPKVQNYYGYNNKIYDSVSAAFSDHVAPQCAFYQKPMPCGFYMTPSSQYDSTNVHRETGNVVFVIRPAGLSCPSDTYLDPITGECIKTVTERLPQTPQQLDQKIDESYEPQLTDAPLVLLSGKPETITLTTPPPAELPTKTTTSTDSSGQTITSVTTENITYNVVNNSTNSPSINSSATQTTINYDASGNALSTVSSTTNSNAVQTSPSGSPVGDLPAFCSWASIVCDWLGWTQEELGEEEPDLSTLISEFEPDETAFNLGIGSGTCPAPIQLNLAIINKTVEVSYQPFCDFVTMIKPFILAAAYLFAAYLYIGVLKRG